MCDVCSPERGDGDRGRAPEQQLRGLGARARAAGTARGDEGRGNDVKFQCRRVNYWVFFSLPS